jgi:hypothetical protein
MFPWLWLYAPQFHLPWSGAVAQQIAPDTHWFFSGIRPGAGDARIEEQAFGVASYGKQLGLITEVLLALAQESPPASAKAQESIDKLTTIQAEIERLKTAEYERVAVSLAEQMTAIRQRGGARAKALEARLRQLPLETSAS